MRGQREFSDSVPVYFRDFRSQVLLGADYVTVRIVLVEVENRGLIGRHLMQKLVLAISPHDIVVCVLDAAATAEVIDQVGHHADQKECAGDQLVNLFYECYDQPDDAKSDESTEKDPREGDLAEVLGIFFLDIVEKPFCLILRELHDLRRTD